MRTFTPQTRRHRPGITCCLQVAPEARDELDALETYIATAGATEAAARYVDAIVTFCVALDSFPERGVPRDDLLPGPVIDALPQAPGNRVPGD
jgi:plasmid stabilization system protein ParE